MSYSVALGKLRRYLKQLDWGFIRGSAMISAGSAGARLLAMVYWLILARAFTPDAYGSVQYAITLAMLVALLAHPVGQHVAARFIGRHREERGRLPALLTNLIAVLLGVFGLSLVVAVPALALLGALSPGVLVVAAGVTLFYAYWGLANGLLYATRLTMVYLGSNLIQLVATFVAITLLGSASPQLALLIYGGSYLPAILLMQLWRPLPLSFRPALLSGALVGEILRFSWPVWVSHIAFTIRIALPVLLLNHYAGPGPVGIFALASTLAGLFGVVSLGLATQLMPTIAGAPSDTHRALLGRSLAVLLAVSAALLAVYVPAVQIAVPMVFGPSYLSSPAAYGLLAAEAIVAGVNGLLTAALVGSGQVRGEAAARLLGLAVTGMLGLLLTPRLGLEGASLALLLGGLASLALSGFFIGMGPRVMPEADQTGAGQAP